MALGIVPIAHIVAAVFSIIELGLVAYIISTVYNGQWFHGYYGDGYAYSPDQVNFMLWNAIWSLVVLAYVGLAPLYLTSIFHKLAALALEAITVLFWFAGSIAMAVFLGVPQCGADSFCGTWQAAIAFGFFLWAIFTFLLVLDTLEAMRSRGHSTRNGHHHHHTKPYAGA